MASGWPSFDELIDRDNDISVAANISLPTSTFALSGTVAKTSAVLIQKRTTVHRTVLARASTWGLSGRRARQQWISRSEVPEVVTGIEKALTLGDSPVPLIQVSESPLVASISSEALMESRPSRIDPAALASRSRLEQRGGVRLSEYLSSRRKQSQKRSDAGLTFVSVLHVDALRVVSWPDAEQYEPTTPGQIAHAGEVLVSLLNPSKLRAAVIPQSRERVICSRSSGCSSLTPIPTPFSGCCTTRMSRRSSSLLVAGRRVPDVASVRMMSRPRRAQTRSCGTGCVGC